MATGRMDEASSLAERWCRERPEWQSARTLNPVAQALARGGGGAGARRALAWMRGCGVEPDDATWNALVDAAVDGGGSGAAEEVLGMAEAAGARVGVWGWNALVKVRMAAGAAWLQRRRRAACEGRLRAGAGPGKRGASGRGPGCVGSDVGGRSGAQPRDIRHPNGGGSKGRGRGAVSGDLRGRGGQGCQARGGGLGVGANGPLHARPSPSHEMSSSLPRSFGAPEWNALIAAQAREAGPGVDDAFRTLGRMVHAGVQPTAVTYNTLMAACAREGDHASVVHLFSTMEEAGIQASVGLWCVAHMCSLCMCSLAGNTRPARDPANAPA